MKKITKLKICDWSLAAIGFVILASGLQLEFTHGESALWVWLHIAIGIIMLALLLWHLYLHFGKSGWWSKFKKKKPGMKALSVFFALTFLLGIGAIPQYIVNGHCGIGGVHGKLGYIFIIMCVVHGLRHKTFYKKR